MSNKEYTHNNITCPYCKQPAHLVTGCSIYPHRPDLHSRKFWMCKSCDAYVGCHRQSDKHGKTGMEPLGRLANKDLRFAKSLAHIAFDSIWKTGKRTRKESYIWLSGQLGIPEDSCHIGLFDEATCMKVVEVCFVDKFKN